MFFPWVSVLTLLRILEGANGESVTQPEDRLTVSQGEPALLKCSYDTSYIPTLWWYEQYPNEAPRLLLGDYEASDEEESRSRRGFFATADKQGKTFHLKKNSTELRDSAVYYCAMSAHRGGGEKLIFGSGTKLIVRPNLEESKASIYRVKSQNGIYSACLITDFSPGNIKVGFSEDSLTEVNASVVQVKNPDSGEMEASYGTVLLVDQENTRCIAKQGWEQDNVTESAEEGDTCKIMELDDNFETDNQLNLLSFTLLGLRIVFVKGVALNLLLTFWLWKS